MKLNTDSTAETHWEDAQEVEWDIRIHFEFSPAEPQTYQDPGCDEYVEITGIDRNEIGHDDFNWAEWQGATGEQIADWRTEIMEAIVAQAKDAYDEDRSEDYQLEQ